MKTKRTILFRVGAIILLLIIAGIMMLIGRGHTVYLDSKDFEYNGQKYEAPYKIVVYVDDEQVAKLYNKERGMATCIGQTFEMTIEVTQEKGGNEETIVGTIALPYNMDGIAINLPAYLAGLPEDAFLSEFQIATVETESSSEEVPADEFGIGGDL